MQASSRPAVRSVQGRLIAFAQPPVAVTNRFMTTQFEINIGQIRAITHTNLRKYFSIDTAPDSVPVPLHQGGTTYFKALRIGVPMR